MNQGARRLVWWSWAHVAFGVVCAVALVLLADSSPSPPEAVPEGPRAVQSPVLQSRPSELPPSPLPSAPRPAVPEPRAGGEKEEAREEEKKAREEEKEVVRRPAPEAPPDVARDVARDAAPDVASLRGRLEKAAERYPGRYGVVVLDPDSRRGVSLRGDEVFTAASIGKLPALIGLYRAAARGELRLDDEIVILPGDVQDGTGVLRTRAPGTKITLRECAYYLMNKSDNTAWAMLDRHLGKDYIQAELASVGTVGTDYYAVTTTPKDILLMLEKISDPSFTNEKLSAEMLATMTDTAFEDRIPAPLPPETRVAHKIGSFEDSFGDAGIVFYEDRAGAERRYFIVVLSGGTAEGSARSAMQEMSLAAYEALAVPRRDAFDPEK